MFRSYRLDKRESQLFFLSVIIILIFVSPYFILGEDAHLRVHDNLDSNIAWYKVLSESDQLLGGIDSTIPQIINGQLDRGAFGTELSGIVWLHVLFSPMIAYGLSQLVTRLFAFLGMYLLLRNHFITSVEYSWIRIGTSLAFALTPFWPSGMLSTLGMPLALWALLNIRAGRRSWTNWVTLTLLPFYSSFVLGFFFFISAIGIFWLADIVRGKGLNLRFLLAIIYFSLVFVFVEYRLFYSFFFINEPNSRDEYFHARLSLLRTLRLALKNYVLGHTHVMTVHSLIILPVSIYALFIVFLKRIWKQEKVFLYLHVLNALLSIWYAFWFYKGWVPITERFHFLNTFNFARYHFLRPMVIYVLFALSLKIIWMKNKSMKQWCMVFMIAQLVVVSGFNEEIRYKNKPSFKEFYAETQFTQIKKHIDQPLDTFRIASIGIHPAIAQFNGFYTLDTYNNFYPLPYKHQFREIIAAELDKNKQLKQYFDEWGGRCYIFLDELGKNYMFTKTSKKEIKKMDLNIEPFMEMGGRYLFSALPIKNAQENGLHLEKIFDSNESAWRIYLYKVQG
ncbi:DUF6044 family protein [Ferdinandcohnia quinoae]|uniref:DUF6044 family protein n=1 Tax=Fredinandcohnia quinoae TaxID=2918902 RepID=A0AAW5DY76_9BACI|nr:DUF6044 family protein [Fredinandcohnia sp. SECRCQ15]MCH1625592.1 DUF6044 family protein [Fredinandcohnia sp. SECRCQ15]